MTDPNEVLRQAARARELKTTERILEAIADLRSQGLPITVTAISRIAGVSRTSVYARPELLQSAQRHDPHRPRTVGLAGRDTSDSASVVGIRRRLEASQTRNRRLQADNDRLRLELSLLLSEDKH